MNNTFSHNILSAGAARLAAQRLLGPRVGPPGPRGWRAAHPHAHVGVAAAPRENKEKRARDPLLGSARRGGGL